MVNIKAGLSAKGSIFTPKLLFNTDSMVSLYSTGIGKLDSEIVTVSEGGVSAGF